MPHEDTTERPVLPLTRYASTDFGMVDAPSGAYVRYADVMRLLSWLRVEFASAVERAQ